MIFDYGISTEEIEKLASEKITEYEEGYSKLKHAIYYLLLRDKAINPEGRLSPHIREACSIILNLMGLIREEIDIITLIKWPTTGPNQ